jgi:hypothetical protein
MTESEKFRTERLVARPWQIEDLLLAMELWGDPAVTALIDSRGKLTNAQVGEKLRAEKDSMAKRTKHPRTPKPPIKEKRADQSIIPGLRPAQYQRIGQVIASWSNLEATRQQAIWTFLKLSDDDGRLVTGRMDARPKVEWLRALGERYLPEGKCAEAFFEALARISELQDDRNFIAHGVWGRLQPDDQAIAMSPRKDTAPGKIVGETFPDARMKAMIHDMSLADRAIRRALAQLSSLRDGPQ